MFESEFVQQTLTPLLAILGASLGIWNFWISRRTHAIRVRVEATLKGENDTDGLPYYREIGVKVINSSAFAVTAEEYGILIREGRELRQFRFGFSPTYELEKKRIDARSAKAWGGFAVSRSRYRENPKCCDAIATGDLSSTDRIAGVYVRLATGQRIRGDVAGSRRFIRKLIDCLRSIQAEPPKM